MPQLKRLPANIKWKKDRNGNPVYRLRRSILKRHMWKIMRVKENEEAYPMALDYTKILL